MLAGSTGLEPAASGVTGRRSNQLNYDPERTMIFQISEGRFQIGVSVQPVISICVPIRNLKSAILNLMIAEWAVQDSNL